MGGDMTFTVFRQLSIHFVKEDARRIDVEIPEQTRSRVCKRSAPQTASEGVRLTNEEKQEYRLGGDFVWGGSSERGNYVKAISAVWQCPFLEHEHNRQLDVSEEEVYCYGCKRRFYLTKRCKTENPETPEETPETPEETPEETAIKEQVIQLLRPDSRFSAFFHTEYKRLGGKNRELYFKEFLFRHPVLIRNGRRMEFQIDYIIYDGKKFKTPSAVRDLLFHGDYTRLDDVLDVERPKHPNPIDRPEVTGSNVRCGAHAPAISFGDELKVEPKDRQRCAWKVISVFRTLLMILSMGSGKTKALIDFLSEYANIQKSVLVVVGRKSFGGGFFSALQDTEQWLQPDATRFVYYRKESKYNEAASSASRVVCCINSLEKVLKSRSSPFDVVVLDETVLLLESFNSSTMTNKRIIWGRLVKVCSEAKYLFAMDADLNKTQHGHWFIKDVCGRESTKLESVAETDHRLYLEVSPFEDLYAVIYGLVQRGLKVAICSNTAVEIQNIHNRLTRDFPEKKGLAIFDAPGHEFDCVKIGGEKRAFDQSKDTIGLNWFAYSPSLSPGCSIDDPFDVLVAHAMASELAAGPRYWQQMLHRIRNFRKNLVLFKIENKGVMHLSLNIEDIIHEKEQGKTWLTAADVDVDYSEGAQLDPGSFTMNAVFNEQQTRFSGYFREKIVEWKRQDGATFGFLALSQSAEEKLMHKKKTQETKRNERDKLLRDIADADLDVKVCKFSEAKKKYLLEHYIPFNVNPDDLFRHLQKYYQKETVSRFCKMCEKIPESDDFTMKKNVFEAIIAACGFSGIDDDRLFSEAAGKELNLAEIRKVMERLQTKQRLAEELELSKALKKGPDAAYTWAKYALNKIGSQLGLCSREIRLMVGDHGRRVWSLRGIKKGEACNDLFNSMLELRYLRLTQRGECCDDAIFADRTQHWPWVWKAPESPRGNFLS
jgi:hypothetical protein